MKAIDTAKERHEWKILAKTPQSNAASMVLKAGTSTGGPQNKHEADQWLLILKGRGTAIVAGKSVALDAGTLLLIESNETHEIKAGPEDDLVTLNFYAPAYEE